jgi:predicted P-loop ATPase
MSKKTVVPAVLDVEEQPYNYPLVIVCHENDSVITLSTDVEKTDVEKATFPILTKDLVRKSLQLGLWLGQKVASITSKGHIFTIPNLLTKDIDRYNSNLNEYNKAPDPYIFPIKFENTLVRVRSVRNPDESGASSTADREIEQFPDVDIILDSKGEPKKTIILKTLNNFRVLLRNLGYGLWYDENTWEVKVERNGKLSKKHLDDIIAELHTELEIARIPVHISIVGKWINYIARENKKNPFKDWITAVPHTWDGTPYLDAWCDSVHQEQGSITDDMKNLILKRHIVGAVGLQLDKHPNHPYIVMLLGDQGIGKGQKLHELFTGDRFGSKPWAKFDIVHFDPKNKDCLKQIMTCAMVEFGELENMRKQEQSAWKGFTSQQEWNHTDKYSNNPTKVPKRTSMWATGNFNEALADSSGARRFLPISVIKLSFDYPDDFTIQKVWADAVYLYSQKFTTYFNKEEEVELYNHKALYMASNQTDILFERYFEIDTPIEKWKLTPFHAIATSLNLDLSRASTRQIGASLRRIAKNPNLNAEQVWSNGTNVRQILCPPARISVSQIGSKYGVLVGGK